MKKTLLLFALAALATIFFVNCSPATQGDPETVIKTFAERLAKKDFDGAAELATKASQPTLTMVKMGMEMAEKMKSELPENDPVAAIASAEFGNAKIEGNTAIVPVTSKVDGQEMTYDFYLLKENGQWKVDFSTETLTKMGRAKFENADGPESLNMDSIARNIKPEDLETAKRMADSIMNNMDPQQLEELKKQFENLRPQQ